MQRKRGFKPSSDQSKGPKNSQSGSESDGIGFADEISPPLESPDDDDKEEFCTANAKKSDSRE